VKFGLNLCSRCILIAKLIRYICLTVAISTQFLKLYDLRGTVEFAQVGRSQRKVKKVSGTGMKILPAVLFVKKANEIHWLCINELHGKNFTRWNRQRCETRA
jgi:hypothetical protein